MNTFEEIKGQEFIKNSLQNALRTGKTSHLYIISGENGSGKLLIACTLAKTLMCHKGGITPCCLCISCKTFDSGNHPDVFYPKPVKTKSLGVADAREQILKPIETKPYNSKYKIFIVDKSETMSVEMQNALLKTIEEPPKYGVFIFTADNTSGFLPTVLSRAVVLKTLPLAKNDLTSLLINKLNIEEKEAQLYSSISGGIPGKAFDMAQSGEFKQMRKFIMNVLLYADSRDIVDDFTLAKEFEPFKDCISDLLGLGMLLCRDALIIKNTNSAHYVAQNDISEFLDDFASRYDNAILYNMINILEYTITILKQNANFNLAIEVMLLKLKETAP